MAGRRRDDLTLKLSTPLADLPRRPEGDSSATLLATASEGDTMAVYRIEQGLPECTEERPYAVVEVDDVESLKVMSLWPTEEAAQRDLDAVTAVSDGFKEALGGKPNQGTPKDKRLHENDPKTKKKGKKSALQQAMEFAAGRGGPITQDEIDALAVAEDIGSEFPEQTAEEIEEALTAATKVKDKTPTMAGWNGTLVVEGITTGDQREFAKGALTWADPPIPLRWKKEDAHGGQNDVTVAVGSITSLRRVANRIEGEGVFDLGSEDGREAHRRMKEVDSFGGISIDADDITGADIEFIWPEIDDSDSADEDDILMMLFAEPEKILFHAGRIRAATLVDIPAFVEAKIALTASGQLPDGADELEPAAVLDEKVRQETAEITLVAAGVKGPLVDKDAPPREWFTDPKLSVPMNIIVTDEGRVYGHAAHWGECHIGHADMCRTPPYESSRPYFATGEMVCADGSRVQVGQITIGTGHAPLAYSAQRAAEHYDNTGTAVADVCIGNDEHGIWVAGAVRPWVDTSRVKELRASGKVSGDWRRIAGSLRMVGLLAVNVAGFQTPQPRARLESGRQLALVAAGIPRIGAGNLEDVEKLAMRLIMKRLSAEVHGTEET